MLRPLEQADLGPFLNAFDFNWSHMFKMQHTEWQVAGHSLDIIAVEGQDVRQLSVTSINMYIGSRYDVLICFDQVNPTSWSHAQPANPPIVMATSPEILHNSTMASVRLHTCKQARYWIASAMADSFCS